MAKKPSIDILEAMERLEEHFGDRIAMLGFNLITLSQIGQLCDVTFYNRKPILNVARGSAIMFGNGLWSRPQAPY